MKKKHWSRLLSVVLAVVMVAGLLPLTGAAAGYSVDLNLVSDEEWDDAAVMVRFNINGIWSSERLYGDDYMGRPVLLNIGKQWGQDDFAVTYIPIRLICEALDEFLDSAFYGGDLRINIQWLNATPLDPGHAVLNTPKGAVRLYPGATYVEAEDGTRYEETEYRFPNGAPLPLCLNRNGRIYVPVRFVSSFILNNAAYSWDDNATQLQVNGKIDTIKYEKEWTRGINPNTGAMSDWALDFDYMPNLRKAIDSLPPEQGVAESYSHVELIPTKHTNFLGYVTDPVTFGSGTYALYVQAPGLATGLEIKGLMPEVYNGALRNLIRAALEDTVKLEKDRAAILDFYDSYTAHMNEGRADSGQFTEEAKAWRASVMNRPRELDEVAYMLVVMGPYGDEVSLLVYDKEFPHSSPYDD